MKESHTAPNGSERPAWTGKDLQEHLVRSCRVCPGDVLIVHSSLKSIGRVEGGPETVIRAMQSVLTEAGTLLMPVFSGPAPDGVFLLDETPSRTGLITETFRRMPGVLRSRHPTHSVAAWGKHAERFVAGHDRTSGLGLDSPFHKAALARAGVLMIGCGITTCSLVHVCEAIVRVPYLGKVAFPGYAHTMTLVDGGGARHEVTLRDMPGHSGGFAVVQEQLDRRGLLQRCRLGSADCLKFSGRACLDVATKLLRDDPAVLLCRDPDCPVCPGSRRILEQTTGKSREGC